MMEESRPILNGEGSHTNQEITQEKPIEFELTEVIGIVKFVENDIEIQWNDFHILVSMLPRNASTYSVLRTPKLGNTVLHKAAWQGNNNYVDELVRESPNLLFELNANKDTPLHVAARAGRFYTTGKLLAAYADFQRREIVMAWLKYTKSSKAVEDYDAEMNMEDLLGLVKMGNKEGNTMLHEAIYGNRFIWLVACSKNFAKYNIRDRKGESLAESWYKYALEIDNNARKSVLYLAVEAQRQNDVRVLLEKCLVKPKGLSPFVPAIMKQDKYMLQVILEKRPEWIHLIERNGRIPLHYAALTGFLEGVRLIIDKCTHCAFQSDKDGYFPIHLAAYGGHVKLVEELLHHCPEPDETLDNYHRNILHIAAKNGKHDVVHYILNNTNRHYSYMIDQKDCNGDTPLHLATRFCHPKTVYYFTWNNRFDLNSVNFKNQTTLDIINELYQLKGNPSIIETKQISSYQLEKGSVREQLTWIALKSSGAKPNTIVLPVESRNRASKEEVSNPAEGYTKQIENLSVISTLIITASVAACLAVPGEADGRAHNLKKLMFQVFIICITLSFFSSISATIILLWARIGLTELVIYCLDIVLRLMGIALFSLSLAFMAGLYTVISELTWLASVFLGLCVIFIVVGSLLYILLFLPSTSTNKFMRWISYYPFIILATLAETNC